MVLMAEVALSISGGAAMQAALNGIAQRLSRGRSVKVGFLASATYPVRRQSAKSARKAQRKAAVALHVAQVAFWNNFGTSRSRPRPFFTNTIATKSPTWGSDMAKIAVAVNYDGARIMALMGQRIKDQLVDSIAAWPADNAPSTVAKKGFNHGLIQDGTMQRSPDYEVSR